MQKFQRYKRGQIILVDFSPSIGSELKGKHFAIVLTKKDTPNSSVLTVVPLSSKEKSYYLNLGTLISDYVYPILNKHIDDLSVVVNALDPCAKHSIEEINSVLKTFKEIRKVASLYIDKDKNSYALVQNITTISKMRIQKPTNKYDPLKKLTVTNDVLDKIDTQVYKLFITNPLTE